MADPKTRLAEIRAAAERSLSEGASGDRFPAQVVAFLLERIAHLEGLVRLSAAMNACGSGCPFCGAYPKEDDRSVLNHATDCPAFTPEGEIK